MRSDHGAAEGGGLRPRVSFGRRHASPSQTIMSVILWAGTVFLLWSFIWSFFARNVRLRSSNDCSPCSEGFEPLVPSKCPTLCVAKSLKEEFKEKCLGQPPDWSFEDSAFPNPRRGSTDTEIVDHVWNARLGPGNETAVSTRDLRAIVRVRVGGSSDSTDKTLIQLLASPLLLPIFLPTLIVVASLWYFALQRVALCSIWVTAVVFIGSLIFGFWLTNNWVLLVLAALVVVYSFSIRDTVRKGANCLQTGLSALAETQASFATVALTAMMLVAYTGVLFGMLVFSAQIFVVTSHPGLCIIEPASYGYLSLFVVFFILSANYFAMVCSFAIAHAMACWYFHQDDPAAPDVPILYGLKRALLSRNGVGVCGQAAMVMTFTDYMKRRVKQPWCFCVDPVWCFLAVAYIVFHQCLESLRSFTLVAVAIHGGPFFQTSAKAAETLGARRTARFAFVDTSIGWILDLQVQALATVLGIAAWATIDNAEGLGIFRAIVDVTSASGHISAWVASWCVVLFVLLNLWVAKRPLLTIAVVMTIYFLFGQYMTKFVFVNSAMAALILGSIGSLVLHQFRIAAAGALSAMLYCWTLEEAVGGAEGAPGALRGRRQVVAMWEQTRAMASAPPEEIFEEGERT